MFTFRPHLEVLRGWKQAKQWWHLGGRWIPEFKGTLFTKGVSRLYRESLSQHTKKEKRDGVGGLATVNQTIWSLWEVVR